MAGTKLQFNKKSFRGFTGNQLKSIAFLLMLCDHIGYMLIENGVLYAQNPYYWNLALATPEGQRWFRLAQVLRWVGRIAYPLFAFAAAEGCRHSANVRKYLGRLLILALISEVPFDLACQHKLFYPEYQNVVFTLFLGVAACAFMTRWRKSVLFLRLLAAAFFAAAAWFIRSDYGPLGVILICIFYMLNEEKTLMLWSSAALCAAESIHYFGASALAIPLIRFYNGKRGAYSLKYFFYIMYPLQLLLFWFLVYFNNR